VSRTVVAKTMKALGVCGLRDQGIADLPDSRLLQALACAKAPQPRPRYQQLAVRFPNMVKEPNSIGVTHHWLWERSI